MELKKRLLTEPGDMVELALNGERSDGLRSVPLVYGLRGVLAERSSDSWRMSATPHSTGVISPER